MKAKTLILILLIAGLFFFDSVFGSEIIINDADSVWIPELIISSDVIDSKDAVSPILTEAIVSNADSVWQIGLENQISFGVDPYLGTSTPVILIPGFGGSWEVPVPPLYLTKRWELDPITHTYDNLWIALDKAGYERDKTLFALPYDWRKSNIYTAQLLKERIEEIKGICNCDKVNIVAHSMGGLVARAYIEGNDYQNDVNKLIFLGTPHKGATKAYLGWEGGDMGKTLIDYISEMILDQEAYSKGYTSLFKYIRGFPISSAQELLPIFDYLKDADTGLIREYPEDYPQNAFLEQLNSPVILERLKNVKVVNIIGKRGENSTINILRVVNDVYLNGKWENGCPENYGFLFTDQGLEYAEGDGTVPARSNTNFGIGKEIIFKNTGHGELVTEAQKEIIQELTGVLPDHEEGGFFDTIKNFLVIRIFSPADFVVIAPNGERLGKDFNANQLINEIDGAFYSGFGDEIEFAVIPNPQNGDYRVELQGTGNGDYKLSLSYIDENQAIDSDLKGEIILNQIQKIDFEYIELEENSSDPLTGLERILTIDAIIRDVEDIYLAGGFPKSNIQNQIIEYLEEIKSSKITIRKKQLTQLEEKLAKYLNQGFITQNGYDILINDINYLIINL